MRRSFYFGTLRTEVAQMSSNRYYIIICEDICSQKMFSFFETKFENWSYISYRIGPPYSI